jgi:DNA polymerase III sliding clamp (beta) subunit (PCNA family)
MKIKTKTLVDILEMSSQFLLKTTTNPIIANTYVYKEEDNLIFKSYNGINYVKVVVPFD